MRVFVASLLLALAGAVGNSTAAPYGAAGGSLQLTLETGVLQHLGVAAHFPMDSAPWNFAVAPGGTLDFRLHGGDSVRVTGGSLAFRDGPVLRWADGSVDLSHFRLERRSTESNAMAIVDADREPWFTLHMGHFDLRPEASSLDAFVMDLRLAPEFADKLGVPDLAGQFLGSAQLTLELAGFPAMPKGNLCSVPQWPTEPGLEADLEMIDISRVDELPTSAAREAGRVIITPSAIFRNIGTADLPWFQVFTSPELDPQFCLDDGNGNCQPYGNDQQGLLVWNLYRLQFGRLEQIGRSGLKHAFNSVNDNCPCNFGRIVWRGCEDLYSASTNVDQRFLGSRDKVEAHPVLFDACGSVFDADCDNQCDNPSNGFVKCLANPAEDSLDRRLSVPETALQAPGSRYFMEAWYLVRDDVNIYNSMGFREVVPQLLESNGGSVWDFDFADAFRNGPVVAGLAADAGLELTLHETGDGSLGVAAGTQVTLEGRRYKIVIMNFDFDPQLSELAIPLAPGSEIIAPFFSDGDDDSGNDWNIEAGSELLVFRAPDGEGLDWGTMYTFEFESALEPAMGRAALGVLAPATAGALLGVALPRPAPAADFIHGSSFES